MTACGCSRNGRTVWTPTRTAPPARNKKLAVRAETHLRSESTATRKACRVQQRQGLRAGGEGGRRTHRQSSPADHPAAERQDHRVEGAHGEPGFLTSAARVAAPVDDEEDELVGAVRQDGDDPGDSRAVGEGGRVSLCVREGGWSSSTRRRGRRRT